MVPVAYAMVAGFICLQPLRDSQRRRRRFISSTATATKWALKQISHTLPRDDRRRAFTSRNAGAVLGRPLDVPLRVSGTVRRSPYSGQRSTDPDSRGFPPDVDGNRGERSCPDGQYHHQMAKVPTSAWIVMTILYVPLFRVLGSTTWTQSALMAIGYTLSFVLVQMVMLKTRGRRRATPQA